jgi:hypothetical protein
MRHSDIRTLFVGALLLSLAVLLPPVADVGDYEDGLAASKRGDYNVAVRWFTKAAARGDASAARRQVAVRGA